VAELPVAKLVADKRFLRAVVVTCALMARLLEAPVVAVDRRILGYARLAMSRRSPVEAEPIGRTHGLEAEART